MSKNRIFSRRRFLQISAGLGIAGIASAGIYKLTEFSSDAKGKIVVIGGGAAGLSMSSMLERYLKEPDITVIDPSDKHFYQPGFTLIGSGVYKPDEVWKKQEDCITSGVKWIKDSVVSLNPDTRKIQTAKSGEVTYDFLVLTPGLQINWEEVEGITRDSLGVGNAHSIYDFEGAQKTWEAIQEFGQTGGKGVYTDTYTKHKCGGAPKKICLLTEHHLRKQKNRDKAVLNFYTASKELYDVPHYTPRLLEIYEERDVSITLNTRLRGIDTTAKQAYFETIEKKGEETLVTPFVEDYDFLHFTPPMYAPDFVREAGLSWDTGSLAKEGWVMVDKETLIHTKYPDSIVCLGDCAGVPTSKTSAAIRKQVPVAARNLIAIMEGKEPTKKYNGYAACPIITDYGHVLLAEFDYDKNPQPTFPFSLLDMSKEQAAAWTLKVEGLKPIYFYQMLNGYS